MTAPRPRGAGEAVGAAGAAGRLRRYLGLPLAVFLLLRVALLAALAIATGRVEFTQDWWVFALGARPLSVMTFSADASGYSQPPLFPVVVAPLLYPLLLLFGGAGRGFVAARVAWTFFELTAFLLTAAYLDRSETSDRDRRRALLVFALSPLGFVTGAVMRQEEAIVAAFVAGFLLAWQRRSWRGATLVAAFGVLTAKILAGILYFPLLWLAWRRRALRDVLAFGLVPLCALLAVYSAIGYAVTGTIPFLGFAPSDTSFSASPFTLLQYFGEIPGGPVKWLSLSLVAAGLAGLAAALRGVSSCDLPTLCLASFCVLFLGFYHINTEYHVFILPLLAVVPYSRAYRLPRWWLNGSHALLAVSTWSFGIVYGVRLVAEGVSEPSAPRAAALDLLRRILGPVPILAVEVAALLVTLGSVALILAISLRAIRVDASQP